MLPGGSELEDLKPIAGANHGEHDETPVSRPRAVETGVRVCHGSCILGIFGYRQRESDYCRCQVLFTRQH